MTENVAEAPAVPRADRSRRPRAQRRTPQSGGGQRWRIWRSHGAGPYRVPWILAVPGVVLLLAWHFAAPLSGSWYAFTDWDGFNTPHFVGWDNFVAIFRSPVQTGALKHSFILAGCYVVLVNVIGLGLALALNRTLKTRTFLRLLFFAPAVLSPLAVSFIWKYIFSYDGALNLALGGLGLGSWKQSWLGNPDLAIWTILVVMVWQHAGQAMIIYLAGLQGIPDELEEATIVDGATTWMRLRRVTLPLLAPAFTIVSTLMLIMGLRIFDQVFALTEGGPAYATETMATQVFEQTFTLGKFGFGSAIAMVMTLIVLVFGIGNLLVQRRRERRL